MLTTEQLIEILPKCKDPETWVDHLNTKMPDFGIYEDDTQEIASFLAQCGHESMHLNVLEENLNYSATGLQKTFGKYFRNTNVNRYHRQPEMIANRVYANRMGNGPEESGDGWKYRGSGIIQLTGKNNYRKCSLYLYDDETILLDHPEHVREYKEVAVLAALWFWKVNGLLDIDDPLEETRVVNGGENGLEDRLHIYEKALEVLT